MYKQRKAAILFSFLLSGMMSCIVTGIATLRVLGFTEPLLSKWMSSWMFGWLVAFPVVYFVAPMVRKIVDRFFQEQK